ncbi:MAG: DMT family transporter [Anaerolineae bacterium]|nr:DMT family transporter [Anaerolineae bacterium]
MAEYTGEIAGLLTSLCWSCTSIFFTLSGRLVGSPVVNRTRLLLALLMVSGMHWAMQGAIWPVYAAPERWGWFALSGILGFVIGDALLFQAFVMIGPRLAMLLMALHPVMGTIMAWVLLHETLTGLQILGILLAVSGVVWVVAERQNGNNNTVRADLSPRHYVIGVLFGLGGALGQATGFIASKQGLADDFPALSGNMIRLIIAAASIWLFTAFNGQVRAGVDAIRAQPRALRFILGGAIAGPFLGVWFSLIAVQNAPVGVASTLTSLPPIILIPLGFILFRERITRRAIVGTAIALSGTTVLFLA